MTEAHDSAHAVLEETYDPPHHGRSEDIWDGMARVALALATVVFLGAIIWWMVVLFIQAAT